MAEAHQADFKLDDVILGGQDGLVNVLGVILGVAAASSDARLVIAAGLAATFAESVSMAAVAYTSKMAKADFYDSEWKRESQKIEKSPEREREEIRGIYRSMGFNNSVLEGIVQKITSDRRIWLGVMMKEGLKIEEEDRRRVFGSSVIVGLSAVLGSLVPLSPFMFLNLPFSVYGSLLVSTLTLFVLGAYKARITVGRPVRSGSQMAIIGIVSALAGYIVGLIFRIPAI